MLIQIYSGTIELTINKGLKLIIEKIITPDVDITISVFKDRILKVENIYPARTECSEVSPYEKFNADMINLEAKCNIKLYPNTRAVLFSEDYFLNSQRTIKLTETYYHSEDLKKILWADELKEFFLSEQKKLEEAFKKGEVDLKMVVELINLLIYCNERKDLVTTEEHEKLQSLKNVCLEQLEIIEPYMELDKTNLEDLTSLKIYIEQIISSTQSVPLLDIDYS
ncbi:MAG: hypothetical protein K0Q51_407 [Rickettsiaceae bacterium]|jgi:hypothetical protein|nr:hypothetical protein [Rickettsiaceae bacterium]